VKRGIEHGPKKNMCFCIFRVTDSKHPSVVFEERRELNDPFYNRYRKYKLYRLNIICTYPEKNKLLLGFTDKRGKNLVFEELLFTRTESLYIFSGHFTKWVEEHCDSPPKVFDFC
jgi:hypothetical protein